MNLKQRLNSRSSRSTNQSASQSDSSSVKSGRSGNHINSLERNNSRKSLERSSSIKAPAKPPRSTRNSSSSSSIRKEKSISDDSNSSSRNNSLDKRIIAVQERIILILIRNYSQDHDGEIENSGKTFFKVGSRTSVTFKLQFLTLEWDRFGRFIREIGPPTHFLSRQRYEKPSKSNPPTAKLFLYFSHFFSWLRTC